MQGQSRAGTTPDPSLITTLDQGAHYSTRHCPHFTLHTSLFTLHCLLCTLHGAHRTLHTIHFTVHTARCVMHTTHCTAHTPLCTRFGAQGTPVTAEDCLTEWRRVSQVLVGSEAFCLQGGDGLADCTVCSVHCALWAL